MHFEEPSESRIYTNVTFSLDGIYSLSLSTVGTNIFSTECYVIPLIDISGTVLSLSILV